MFRSMISSKKNHLSLRPLPPAAPQYGASTLGTCTVANSSFSVTVFLGVQGRRYLRTYCGSAGTAGRNPPPWGSAPDRHSLQNSESTYAASFSFNMFMLFYHMQAVGFQKRKQGTVVGGILQVYQFMDCCD